MLGIVNVEPSSVVIVFSDDDLGQYPLGVITSHLKEMKVIQDRTKDKNAWKSFIRNCPTHASMKSR